MARQGHERIGLDGLSIVNGAQAGGGSVRLRQARVPQLVAPLMDNRLVGMMPPPLYIGREKEAIRKFDGRFLAGQRGDGRPGCRRRWQSVGGQHRRELRPIQERVESVRKLVKGIRQAKDHTTGASQPRSYRDRPQRRPTAVVLEKGFFRQMLRREIDRHGGWLRWIKAHQMGPRFVEKQIAKGKAQDQQVFAPHDGCRKGDFCHNTLLARRQGFGVSAQPNGDNVTR